MPCGGLKTSLHPNISHFSNISHPPCGVVIQIARLVWYAGHAVPMVDIASGGSLWSVTTVRHSATHTTSLHRPGHCRRRHNVRVREKVRASVWDRTPDTSRSIRCGDRTRSRLSAEPEYFSTSSPAYTSHIPHRFLFLSRTSQWSPQVSASREPGAAPPRPADWRGRRGLRRVDAAHTSCNHRPMPDRRHSRAELHITSDRVDIQHVPVWQQQDASGTTTAAVRVRPLYGEQLNVLLITAQTWVPLCPGIKWPSVGRPTSGYSGPVRHGGGPLFGRTVNVLHSTG